MPQLLSVQLTKRSLLAMGAALGALGVIPYEASAQFLAGGAGGTQVVSVLLSNIRLYGAANMPNTDGVANGGAVDLSCGLDFSDFSANDTAIYFSEQTETITLTLTGRNASGTEVSGSAVTPTTAGATESSPVTWKEMLKGVKSALGANSSVAICQATPIVSNASCSTAANSTSTQMASIGLANATDAKVGTIIRYTGNFNYQLRKVVAMSGNTAFIDRDWTIIPMPLSNYSTYNGMLFETAPNELKKVQRPIFDATPNVSGAALSFYAKGFFVNTNPTADVLSAQVSMNDPTGVMTFGVCNALNDTFSDGARQTLPTNGDSSAITFSGATKNCVSSKLTHGNSAAVAQAVWLCMTLPAGNVAIDNYPALALTGTSAT